MPEELSDPNLIQDIRIRSVVCHTPESEIPAHPAKPAMKHISETAAQPAMKRTRRRQHHPLLRYRPPGRRPLERLSDSATASRYSALSLCCCKSVMHCVSPAEALQLSPQARCGQEELFFSSTMDASPNSLLKNLAVVEHFDPSFHIRTRERTNMRKLQDFWKYIQPAKI